MFAAVVAVSVFAFRVADAGAQVLVGAALGQSHQEAGASDRPYLGPGFGGTAISGIGMIDVSVGSHVSVGGEVSAAGSISGAQSERVAGGNNALTTTTPSCPAS